MVVVRAGAGGEAAALVVITILGVIGNAVVVVTLLRRSLLHHPSNRLVLSLTASNLLLTLVVLPVLVASVVLGPPYHDPNTPLRTTISVLASQNTTLRNTTQENNAQVMRVQRNEATEEATSHNVDSQPFWESREGEQDLVESWTGQDNVTEGLQEGQKVAPSSGGGDGGGSVVLCQGAAFLANLVTAASAITVAIIALDRYLAIVRPMVYGVMVTGNRCLVLLGWCWIQAALTALPPLLGWARYEHHGPEGRCGVAWDSSPSYTGVWVVSVFIVPLIIMVICYYFILQVARNKCRRIHVGTVLGSRGSTITPDASSICVEVPAPTHTNSLEVPHGTPLPHDYNLQRANGHVVGNGRGPDAGQKAPGNGSDGPTLPVPTLLVSGLEVPKASSILPSRSRSVNGVNKVTEGVGASLVPKRRLAECGRSLSFSQQRSQLVRPCLRRAQSNISMRPSTIRKKLSIGGRKPSWSWEASPAKGFRTVCVVVGTHFITWAPYTALAMMEAIMGPQRTALIPHWATVSSTLLLFTASVFYPIVYGLYNRSIRKEVLACVCPSSSRARRRSCHRHASTLNSNTGSVLDFSSLRQRDSDEQQQQQEVLAAHTLNKGCTPVPIKTISGTLTPLPPLLQLTECEGLPMRGYNFSARKPSQDSGAVMGSTDDTDSDLEGIAPPSHQQRPARRVSAPSILDTVCEDPFVTRAVVHGGSTGSGGSRRGSSSSNSSSVSRTSQTLPRKLPILPLSPQLLRVRYNRRLPMWRSHSLEKLTSCGDNCQESLLLVKKGVSPSPKKTNFLSPLVRETLFSEPTRDRSQRRGSISAPKVMAIPEDTGILECPEVFDSGRGSVDSGEANKSRANREISIDEGIGADCLLI